MSTHRLMRAALLAGLALTSLSALPFDAAFAAPSARSATSNDTATIAEFKQTLAGFGTFVNHERYGEVWVPGVTPPGWHPYPACQWVYAKGTGWYFNDPTEWGKIVHHYGRWQHEAKTGWFWIPDQAWSPGWVSWRMNDKWIGWAPLPPNDDLKTVSADLDTDKLWTLMDAAKFGTGCEGVIAASNVGAVNNVSLFQLPRGIEVDLGIIPLWTIEVITQFIVIDNQCPPPPEQKTPGRPLIGVPVLPRQPESPPPSDPPSRKEPNGPRTNVSIPQINTSIPLQTGTFTPSVTRNFDPPRTSWPRYGSSTGWTGPVVRKPDQIRTNKQGSSSLSGANTKPGSNLISRSSFRVAARTTKTSGR